MRVRLFATSALLAAAVVLPPRVAFAAAPTTQAGRALDYLATQQKADGSLHEALGETADYALGAKFHGLDPTTLKATSGKSVYDYLAAWVGSSTACPSTTNPRDGNLVGKLVQAVVAGGLDPAAFAGRNLLADLEGAGGSTGGAYDAATGNFRDCASSGANAVYAQANAIMALEAAHNPQFPVPPAAVQRLRATQSGSGGWSTFGGDNSNATAMALMALGSRLQTFCGNPPDPTLSSGLRYLHTQQDPASGGITYSSSFATASDPDSDAITIQALVAVGQDPSGAAWTNSHGNPAADLPTFQDPATGGFKFDHAAGTTPDAFTTSQVPAGLDRAPFPDGSAHLIAVTCPAPSPAPLVSATVTPFLPRAGSGASWPPAAAGGTVTVLAALAALGGALVLARRRVTGNG